MATLYARDGEAGQVIVAGDGAASAVPRAKPPARLDQLTGLRFFAALAVFSSHLWPLAEEPNSLRGLANSLFHEGYAGVSFFFMLSGFILAHTYQKKLLAGTISRRKYLVLRAARVGPLHWLVAAPFVVAALAAGGFAALPKVVVNLLLLQSWVPDSAWYFSLVGPSWSLSDELFFYTAFAFLAFLRPKTLSALGVGLLALDIAMVAALVFTGHGAAHNGDAPNFTHWITYVLPLTRLIDFITGMLIYAVPIPKVSVRLATVGEVGSLAVLIAAMFVFPAAGVPEAARMQLAYLPFMALVILTFARGGGLVAAWVGRIRVLVLLGDASFALYLIHLPIITMVFTWWEAAQNPPPLLITCAATLAFCVALSVVIFWWVETPLLKASRRAIDKRIAV
jgi:peptidoglycan/LPS O-acetylase OafA/YrhL